MECAFSGGTRRLLSERRRVDPARGGPRAERWAFPDGQLSRGGAVVLDGERYRAGHQRDYAGYVVARLWVGVVSRVDPDPRVASAT